METGGSGWSWVEVDVRFSNTAFVVHLGTAVYNKHPVKLDDSAPVSLTIVFLYVNCFFVGKIIFPVGRDLFFLGSISFHGPKFFLV